MRRLSYRGFTASVEYDDEDEIFFGKIADIRDGVGFHGETVGKLELAFHQAVDDHFDTVERMNATSNGSIPPRSV